jgi:hypothetical protein
VTQKNLGQQLKGLSIAARLENIERRQEEVSSRNQQVVSNEIIFVVVHYLSLAVAD